MSQDPDEDRFERLKTLAGRLAASMKNAGGEGASSGSHAANTLATRTRDNWWYLVTIPALALLGYLFYLSLSLTLPGIWVAFISLVAFILGLATITGLPFFLTNSPRTIRLKSYRFYYFLLREALYRGLLVKRNHAGVDLCASSFDASSGGEEIKLDGKPKDFEDVGDRMRYLGNNTAFGIALEKSTLLINPLDSAIGRARKKLLDAGEEVVDFGRDAGYAVREHATIPDKPVLLDLSDAEHMAGGAADPNIAEATEEYEQKAWLEHRSVPVMDIMVLAILFAVGAGMVWLAFGLKEGDGDSANGGINIVSGVVFPMLVGEIRYRSWRIHR